MVNFIIFSIILLGILLLGYLNNNEKLKSIHFMDRNCTSALKGIAITFVIWAHMGAAVGVTGLQFIAGVGVSIFTICSGYGLQKSYEAHGLTNYWRKRFVSVALPYYIIAIILLFVHRNMSFNNVLGIFLFWDNEYWYVRFILVCYILFWIYCIVISRYKGIDFFYIFWGVSIAIWFVYQTYNPSNAAVPKLWVRQLLAFPVGMFIAKKQSKVERLNKKCIFILEVVLLIVSLLGLVGADLYLPLGRLESNLCELFTTVPIGIFIVLGLINNERILKNSIIVQLGVMSYEMYLLNTCFFVMIEDSVIAFIFVYGVTTFATWWAWKFIEMISRILYQE